GAAYVIIELTNNVAEPLGLPGWLLTVVIFLLIIGFPVVAILSWIFDITPEGIKKTDDIDSASANKSEAEPVRRKLKGSDVIIAVLIIAVGILVYPKIFNKDNFKGMRDQDGKLSIAVMPFENLSGDSLFNVWQGGIQNLLITTLSNSEEISVRKYQAINTVLEKKTNISVASLTPSFATDLATKLETKTFILGNILKAGDKIRINAQLVDAETEEIYKTYLVDGDNENDVFVMADSLSVLIKNFIEIKKYTEESDVPGIRGVSFTSSSEAFKYYLNGIDAFTQLDMGGAVDWFSKAIDTDSSFINPYVFLSYAYQLSGNSGQAKYWISKANEQRDNLPTEEQLILDHLNAYYFETPNEEIKYARHLIEIDELNSLYWHQLGFAHYKLQEYEEAVSYWERALEIPENWGTYYRNPFIYFIMGNAYHKLDEHDKEEKVLDLGISLFPNNLYIMQYQAICALSQGEMDQADKILSEYKSYRQNVIHCTEAMISSGYGYIYDNAGFMDEAEEYYRNSLKLDPENPYRMNELAWFLIDNDIDVDEGVEILDKAIEQIPDSWFMLDTKGWGLYKQGKYQEALDLLESAWELKPLYDHSTFTHIQEVKQAIAANSKTVP
ncbi:tetratricopeptide repeat protein, partial [bacterium]|nr:tetratricopeptide repeat protein [bacterium]